jgi:hypothetical protein
MAPMAIGAGSTGAGSRLLEWVEQLTLRGKLLLAVCLVLPLAMFVACEATPTALISA